MNHPPRFHLICFAVTFIIALFVSAVFFTAELNEAVHKPFWGDETYGLEYSMRQDSYGSLIFNGVRGQGSTAPLDYIAGKFFDQIKEQVAYFGLNPLAYHRLWPNGVTVFCLLWVIAFFAWEIIRKTKNAANTLLPLSMLLFVAAAFLFNRSVYYYAAEMRPYALWNSCWFAALAMSAADNGKEKFLTVALLFLALSATTSFFQMGCMMLAYILVYWLQNKDIKTLALQVIKIFGLPLVVSLYYCLKVYDWGDHSSWSDNWPQFYELWSHEAVTVPMMLGAAGLCWIKKETRSYAVMPLAVLFLFLCGPLILFTTKMKGFFYTDRQYIYYGLTRAVLLLALIKCLPDYLEKWPIPLSTIKGRVVRGVILLLILYIGAVTAFRPAICRKMGAAFAKAKEVLINPVVIQ